MHAYSTCTHTHAHTYTHTHTRTHDQMPMPGLSTFYTGTMQSVHMYSVFCLSTRLPIPGIYKGYFCATTDLLFQQRFIYYMMKLIITSPSSLTKSKNLQKKVLIQFLCNTCRNSKKNYRHIQIIVQHGHCTTDVFVVYCIK